MFDRLISIDWSGADREEKPVNLRVVQWDADSDSCSIVSCARNGRTSRSWSRKALREWMAARLAESTPTLTAMDFCLGMPWGSDRVLFGVEGWRPLLHEMAKVYEAYGMARAAAKAINAKEGFRHHGPYRFDESRSDFRFYIDHGIPYYRLTDLAAPQAISQWYLGSGGTVGFHSITGFAALDYWIDLREKGEIDFEVFPHETLRPDGSRHVLVESYPAICPKLEDYGPCVDADQKDAWKVLHKLKTDRENGTLADLFDIRELPFGRIDGVEFYEQIQFEGFIFGLR